MHPHILSYLSQHNYIHCNSPKHHPSSILPSSTIICSHGHIHPHTASSQPSIHPGSLNPPHTHTHTTTILHQIYPKLLFTWFSPMLSYRPNATSTPNIMPHVTQISVHPNSPNCPHLLIHPSRNILPWPSKAPIIPSYNATSISNSHSSQFSQSSPIHCHIYPHILPHLSQPPIHSGSPIIPSYNADYCHIWVNFKLLAPKCDKMVKSYIWSDKSYFGSITYIT